MTGAPINNKVAQATATPDFAFLSFTDSVTFETIRAYSALFWPFPRPKNLAQKFSAENRVDLFGRIRAAAAGG